MHSSYRLWGGGGVEISKGAGVTPCSTDFTTNSHQKIIATFGPCYIRKKSAFPCSLPRA